MVIRYLTIGYQPISRKVPQVNRCRWFDVLTWFYELRIFFMFMQAHRQIFFVLKNARSIGTPTNGHDTKGRGPLVTPICHTPFSRPQIMSCRYCRITKHGHCPSILPRPSCRPQCHTPRAGLSVTPHCHAPSSLPSSKNLKVH